MLTHLLRDSAIVKVLDVLLDEWETDFSKADIAKEAGISWKAVTDVWSTLERFGLVKYSRSVCRAKLYRVNKDNPIYKALKNLDMEILKKLDEEEKEFREVVRKYLNNKN